MRRCWRAEFLVACTCCALIAVAVRADDLLPVVVASIHDEPRDGLGDSFNSSSFEGLLREQSTREDRAILEYDVSAFGGSSITIATVSGRVSVNNSFNNGVRTFDFLLYDGNGQADLSDFQISATVVGSGSYHPPPDTFFDFSFDVTAEVQGLITGGATHIGLKVDCSSNPNFPNILSPITLLSITAGATCDPCDMDCSGAVTLVDIPVFVAALLSGSTTGCSPCVADTNGDGSADGADVSGFVDCLIGP